jgi:hypothetical protein
MTIRNAISFAGFALLLGTGCQDHHFATCDITQRDCQEDIYYKMLSLRGDGFDPFGGLPPVSVISENDYRQILLQNAAAQAAQSGPSPWDGAMTLLHFTSTGTGTDSSSTVDDQVANTYAFYRPDLKDVTVISHPNDTSQYAAENAMVTLAHELVHALQDRELDLKKEDFTTSDQYFAYDAIIEGDARFYEYLFTNEVLGLLGRTGNDMLTVATRELATDYDYAAEATPLFVAQVMVYALGARYEALEYNSGGNPAIRRGYSKEPHHMVGYLASDDNKMPPVNATAVCKGPATRASSVQAQIGRDEFGALLFYSFLRGWGVDHATAFATAQTWTGDALVVQASSDLKTTAVSWRIELSTTPPSSIATTLSRTGEIAATSDTRALQITATNSSSPLTWETTRFCD